MWTRTVLHRADLTVLFTGHTQSCTERRTRNHYYGDSYRLGGFTTSLGCFSFPQDRRQLPNWLQQHTMAAVAKSLRDPCTKQPVLHMTVSQLFTNRSPLIVTRTSSLVFTIAIFCWFTDHYSSRSIQSQLYFHGIRQSNFLLYRGHLIAFHNLMP